MELNGRHLTPQTDKESFFGNSTNIKENETPWYKFKVQYDAIRQIKRN